ncbi:MAG TPA: ABC transporter permease [Acidimicrobiales bacterium]|nr:ABC transporter permease [Acidimicrobiales bacterium]
MRDRRAGRGRAGPSRTSWLIWTLSALAVAYVGIPFAALLQRVPWTDLGDLLSRPVVTDALELSVTTAGAATGISLLVGVPLAWVLARSRFPGRSATRALIALPMVLPPVVGGAALLFAFGRRGLLGGPVHDTTGFALPFSIWGVIAANTFVAMPFLVLTVESGFRGAGEHYEDVAATLGANRWTVFWRITVPHATPSIVSGAVLCWARALGEFGATVTFAGNLQGRTQTLPLAVFVALESDRDAAVALSLVLIAVALAVLVPLRHRWLS